MTMSKDYTVIVLEDILHSLENTDPQDCGDVLLGKLNHRKHLAQLDSGVQGYDV